MADYSILGSRNNTNFQKTLYEILKTIPKESDALRYHQKIVTDYVMNVPQVRGIMAYHKMGSGKTRIGSAVSVELYKKDYQVIFLSAKSLHENAREDLRKYYKSVDPELSKDEVNEKINNAFTFVSTKNRATVRRTLEGALPGTVSGEDTTRGVFGEPVKSTKLDNTVLIIDEVHNMLNGIINGSKSDLELYDLIMEARNIKLVLLSGQPVTNTPAELMPLFNMLAGSKIFGESYDDFVKAFVDKEHGVIKNKAKFQNRIFGLVSYYQAKGLEERFPEQLPLRVEKVPMSTKQYAAYSIARDKEIEESARQFVKRGHASRMSRSKAKSSTYRIRTRQISNIHYPEHALVKGKRNSELLTKTDLIDKIQITSPKFHKAWCNIQEQPAHGCVYSQFVESGVGAFAKMLQYRGYTRIRTATDLMSGRNVKKFRGFGLITGDVSEEERTLIRSVFNSPENKHGDVMHLLLFTKTGAEGMDLKAGRHISILEPYWNWALIIQIIARLVRIDSHAMLDKKLRKVQPFIYLSDYPEDLPEIRKKESTTDVEIFEMSKKNQRLIDTFLKALREVSIDCVIHGGENCYTCMPTNERLYIDDILKDIKTGNPCKPITKKKVKVQEIKTDRGTFYYSIDDEGIHIFEKNKQLGGVVEIFADHPDYDDIYTEIDSKYKM